MRILCSASADERPASKRHVRTILWVLDDQIRCGQSSMVTVSHRWSVSHSNSITCLPLVVARHRGVTPDRRTNAARQVLLLPAICCSLSNLISNSHDSVAGPQLLYIAGRTDSPYPAVANNVNASITYSNTQIGQGSSQVLSRRYAHRSLLRACQSPELFSARSSH